MNKEKARQKSKINLVVMASQKLIENLGTHVDAVCCTTISNRVTERELTVIILVAIVPKRALVAFGSLKIFAFKKSLSGFSEANLS